MLWSINFYHENCWGFTNDTFELLDEQFGDDNNGGNVKHYPPVGGRDNDFYYGAYVCSFQ
jgi:hypothetical protein